MNSNTYVIIFSEMFAAIQKLSTISHSKYIG